MPICTGVAASVWIAISGIARPVMEEPIEETTAPVQTFAKSGSRQIERAAT
jgi:hypothetical protein